MSVFGVAVPQPSPIDLFLKATQGNANAAAGFLATIGPTYQGGLLSSGRVAF